MKPEHSGRRPPVSPDEKRVPKAEQNDKASSEEERSRNQVDRDARIPFSARLRFESDDGKFVISGSTSDVSMSGAFLATEAPLDGLEEGAEGVVFVEMTKADNTFEVSFHCVVARVTPRGLGLNFESELDEEEE